MALINGEEVNELFLGCLFTNEEIINETPIRKPIIAEGIMFTVGFDPDKIEKNKDKINKIIDSLPHIFRDGMSFVNLGLDKEGNEWTSSHKTMEELLMLGLAIGKIEYTCSRDMWAFLPYGVPYLIIKK